MLRSILLFVAAPLACLSQNQPFLATNDGTRLFFTTEDLQPGTDQSFRSKLFCWDPEHGIRLVYEAPAGSVHSVSIAGDGSLAAFLSAHPASSPQSQRKGVLLDLRTGQVELPGELAIISRNGRYLYNGSSLVDRVSGSSRPVSVAPRFVGSDGSLLYTQEGTLRRVDPDGTDRIALSGVREVTYLDADESNTVATVTTASAPPIVVHTLTGQSVDLRAAGAEAGSPAFLSADGQWVAMRIRRSYGGAQVMFCRADASGCRVLSDPPVDAYPVAVSGDAGTVYANSPRGVLRIDTNTGRTERPFGLSGVTLLGPVVRGSLLRLYSLNPGDRITLNGREQPVLSPRGVSPVIQIPWDLPEHSASFTMYGGDCSLETVALPQVSPVYEFSPYGFPPADPRESDGQPAFRQDWSATTYRSPAVPGEIVHIYATGLGPVDCPVETGVPAPLNRFCLPARVFEWTWQDASGGTVSAEMLFAGLAPGLVGLYQIDVRVPLSASHGFLKFAASGQVLASVSVRQP